MRRFAFLLLLMFMAGMLSANIIGSYTFATATNGTFTDMTGGTNIMTSYQDDFASPIQTIGFNFNFDGADFTQYYTTSNGQLIFGATTYSSTIISGPIANYSVIAPMGGDNSINDTSAGADTYICTKLTGTSPNQVLTVEWQNFRIPYSSTNGDYSRMQLRLYETTNVIEMVYGTMIASGTTSRAIYLSSNSITNPGCYGFVQLSDLTFNTTTTTAITNAFTAGSITNLDSPTEGSRRVFTFTPPSILPPYAPNPANNAVQVATNLSQLGWTCSPETATVDLYFGTDATPTTMVLNNVAVTSAYTIPAGTLQPGTTYYWQVVARNAAVQAVQPGPIWSFTTALNPVTSYPYVEGLNTIVPPLGWGNQYVSGALAYTYVPTATFTAAEGDGSARYYCSAANSQTRLTTPQFVFAAGSTPVFSFQMYHTTTTGYDTEGVQIQVSTNNTDWTSVGDFFARYMATAGWYTHEVNLAAFAGQTVYVGILGTSQGSYSNFYIDDIHLAMATLTPPNPAANPVPADAAISIATGVTFTWAGGGGLPSGYYFSLGTDNPPTNVVANVDLTSGSYTHTAALAYGTTYYWQVRPYNASGAATGCPVWSFTTVPNPNYGQVGSYHFANSTAAASPSPTRPTYDWVDISATGTDVVGSMGDDSTVGPYELGFTFNYYGQDYTQFYVCSNGWIYLGSTAPGTAAYSNGTIPASGVPNNAIYGYWDDMDPSHTIPADRHVYYGNDGNGNMVISYVNISHHVSTAAETNWITFQIILCRDTNRIKIQYQGRGSTFAENSATVGIENSTGTEAVQYAFDANASNGPLFVTNDNIAVAFNTDANQLGDNISDAGTISGTVTAAAGGAPVENCRVSFGSRVRNTLADGSFIFENVPAETYSLNFYAVGYNEATLNNVVVTANHTTTANMALQTFNGNLPAPTNLTGSFTAVSTASLSWTAPAAVRQTRTERTVLRGYNVYRAGTQLNTTLLATSVTSYVDNTVVAGINAYSVRAVYDQGTSVDSNILNLNYASGILTGTVVSAADNSPISGASVTVDWWNATTAADGTFTINTILEGTYTVNVTATGFNNGFVNDVVITSGQTTNVQIPLAVYDANYGTSGGYYFANNVASVPNNWTQPEYNWVDISETGTDIVSTYSDDQTAGPYPIGFDFTYFGQTYNQFWLCSNGWIALGDSPGSSDLSGSIPDDELPNNVIAPYWDDLRPNYAQPTDQHIYYGLNSDNNLVISYVNIPHYGTSSADNWATFQIMLCQESNRIKFQYQSHGSAFTLDSATIGVENSTGSMGACYAIADDDTGHSGPVFLDEGNIAVAFATDPTYLGEFLGPRGNIEGTVTAATGGAVINGATVTCGNRRSTTDATGHYLLQNVPAGDATVVAYAVGYNQTSVNCTVVDEQTVTCNISMPAFTGTLPAPTNLVGTLISGHEVGLTWTAPAAPSRTSLLQSRSLNVRNSRTVLTGYKVYRNNVFIANVSNTTLQYNDTTPGGGDQVYYVTALYDQGESAHSNSVTVAVIPGTLSGTITSTVTGLPIAGASCNVNDNIATTNAQGVYSILLPVDSGYTLHVTATGYIAGQVANLSISPNQTTTASLSLADDVSTYYPASNLVATVENVVNVNLSWTAAQASPHPVQNYKIYRDGTLVGTVPGTQLTFSQTDLSTATYHYTVTAAYPGGESVVSNTATVIIFVFIPIPPADLAATVANSNDVTLTWTSPLAERTLTWGGNTCPGGIGTNAATDFSVAHRFESSDIAGLNGRYVTSVSFFPRYANCEYSIRVWQGGNVNASPVTPGTLLVDQVVTNVTVGQWNTVQITEPPAINETQELWIGYRCNTQGGMPAGRDAGPAVDWKGNLMYFQGTWTTLRAVSSTSNYNWCISAMVNASPVTRSLTGYKVYRNTSLVGTVDSPTILTYADNDLASGGYDYYVTSLFTEGESAASNTVHVDITSAANQDVNGNVTSLTGNFPNPFNPNTNISFSLAKAGDVRLTVYNSRGQKVRSLVNSSMSQGRHVVAWDGCDDGGNSLSSGVYFYNLSCGRYSSTKKMILMK